MFVVTVLAQWRVEKLSWAHIQCRLFLFISVGFSILQSCTKYLYYVARTEAINLSVVVGGFSLTIFVIMSQMAVNSHVLYTLLLIQMTCMLSIKHFWRKKNNARGKSQTFGSTLFKAWVIAEFRLEKHRDASSCQTIFLDWFAFQGATK